MYEEVNELKGDEMIVLKELKIEIENVKEEVLQCKKELSKFKIKNMALAACLCVLAFVIIYHIVSQQKERITIVFGN
ncbi:unnamed protein product [Thlaspi arvense]|uniref:Uncharacterized protein n=1 Tax=Thlaspi arvense TaxID=13288 RepID=A0AAU9T842_THLAR|nr:unnamed protein product [Thlaspi arvense]